MPTWPSTPRAADVRSWLWRALSARRGVKASPTHPCDTAAPDRGRAAHAGRRRDRGQGPRRRVGGPGSSRRCGRESPGRPSPPGRPDCRRGRPPVRYAKPVACRGCRFAQPLSEGERALAACMRSASSPVVSAVPSPSAPRVRAASSQLAALPSTRRGGPAARLPATGKRTIGWQSWPGGHVRLSRRPGIRDVSRVSLSRGPGPSSPVRSFARAGLSGSAGAR
jgi:hypothetical protein